MSRCARLGTSGAFWICAALAMTLLSPCLFTGWVADDFLHQLMLRGHAGIPELARHPLDLFRFATGEPSSWRGLVGAGVFPWWADAEAKLAFFRPLSSLTHWIDYALWPDSSASMHVQSLLWFALLLAVVAAIYRRFCGPGATALIAFSLFAIDDAHAAVVGWIANRNSLIALSLSLPALLLHDRYRRGGSRACGWLGPLAFAAGLCAGETALVACAYLVAHAACLDRGALRARVMALLPYAAVILGWRVLSGVLGYGVEGSGLYVDPVATPLAFLRIAAERLPVLILAQLAVPWADLWEVYPLTVPLLRPIVLALAALVIGVLVAFVRPYWRASALIRFWTCGALLALLPVCATFPHDRVLLGAGVGAMGLVAELVQRALASARRRDKVVLAALGVVHVVLAPVLLPLRASRVSDMNRVLDAADASLSSIAGLQRKCLVLLNPPLDPFAAYLPVYREAAGRPRPEHLLWLATGVTALTVTTVDATTVRVRAHDGFLSTSSQLMLRDLRRPWRENDVVELDAARIRVASLTGDGRPLEIEVRFDEPLQSEDMLWMRWRRQGYSPIELPPPGGSLFVPAVDIGEAFFG